MRIPNQPNLPQAVLDLSEHKKAFFQIHPLISSHSAELSGSHEKAGVGNSIPVFQHRKLRNEPPHSSEPQLCHWAEHKPRDWDAKPSCWLTKSADLLDSEQFFIWSKFNWVRHSVPLVDSPLRLLRGIAGESSVSLSVWRCPAEQSTEIDTFYLSQCFLLSKHDVLNWVS
jgi:hypothetical protein